MRGYKQANLGSIISLSSRQNQQFWSWRRYKDGVCGASDVFNPFLLMPLFPTGKFLNHSKNIAINPDKL